MRLVKIRIENFRAHADTTLPLSQFGCLIGENNAGKSSVLHALQFAIEGGTLTPDDFRDPTRSVRVTVWFEDVDGGDLNRVGNAEHRDRVSDMVSHSALTLVRTMPPEGRAELAYMSLAPTDPRWSLEAINNAIANKTGATLRKAAVAALPEFDAVLEEKPTVTVVRKRLEELVAALPADQLTEKPAPVKTGIPASLSAMLPEVIYIEAVKDATAETKTTDKATFGKLLKLLLGEVSDHFTDITKQFGEVQRKLSRVIGDNGEFEDDRLEPVRMIEATIEKFVQDSFPGVSLKMDVPSPTLSTILSGAQLRVNDGHEGPLTSKGDGLKRTVLFAMLRAYTSLRTRGLHAQPAAESPASSYLLLFEEPELYLHPRAQRQLMATLTEFAQDHPVLVTTHSPSFFGPSITGFTKLQKTEDGVQPYSVELDLSGRDAYQLVRHENNEPAFFAHTVVLVEGDSDVFTFPHLAKLLNPDWDHDELNIMFVQTGGKGGIGRYRKFFDTFGVSIHVITDLDALVQGFDKLTTTVALRDQHAALMTRVTDLVERVSSPKSEKVKELTARRNARDLWVGAQEQMAAWSAAPSPQSAADVTAVLEELFNLGRGANKTAILQGTDSPVAAERDALIASLTAERVHVLRRGDLEAYYGGTQSREDKVTAAIRFCDDTATLTRLLNRHGADAADVLSDLTQLFTPIYNGAIESRRSVILGEAR
jgi:putative ATP-dependent endonuclease of OLD family